MEKKTTLYIIQGFIASGKTTFSKKLAEDTGAICLNPDEWVSKFYTKDDYAKNWNGCFDKTVTKLWEKAEECLSNGKDVIFDMGFWLKKDRDFARQIACKCNSNCIHYYLYVPDEILKKRIMASRPSRWIKIHLENFEKNKKIFEEPAEEEQAIVINNYN